MQMLHPFGPPICITEVPSEHVLLVNEYVEEAERLNQLERLDYSQNLVGRVRQEIAFREPELGHSARTGYLSFIDYLKLLTLDFAHAALMRRVGKADAEMPRTSVISEWSMWIVRQFSNDYNPVHTHLRFDVSGVLYTMVPDSVAAAKPEGDKSVRDGTIEFVYGADHKFSPGRFRVRPKVGLAIVFPSFAYHVVYPFRDADCERRSISFNAIIGGA